MTRQEARASNVMVEGTISLMWHTARVLFDIGATHSFISSTFISRLNKKSERLKFQLVVPTSIGAEVVTSMYYKENEVMIREVKTQVGLVKLW